MPYHGIVSAFDAATLAQTTTSFDTMPNAPSAQAGIWMAGAAPIVDTSGNLFYATGNSDTSRSIGYYQSIIKLDPTLHVVNFFRPASLLNDMADDDLGSSGPIQIPFTNLLVMGGKGGGTCYIVDMTTLQEFGEWHCVDPDNFSSATHHLHNAMVAWARPDGSSYLYTWGENDYGRAWLFNGTLNQPASSITGFPAPLGMPGGMMTLSASGSMSGTGVLWVSIPYSGNANNNTVQGVLRAFNAENLSYEIWNSTLDPADDSGMFSKGTIPIVANGKVYLGSLSNGVSVYGLRVKLPMQTPSLTLPLL
jgi:hypothetical protein